MRRRNVCVRVGADVDARVGDGARVSDVVFAGVCDVGARVG